MICMFLHRRECIHKKSQQGIQENCVPKFPILSALKLTSCGLVAYTDMNIDIIVEGMSFKTFLKENYIIALDSCY